MRASICSIQTADTLSSLSISRNSRTYSAADTPMSPWSPTDEDVLEPRGEQTVAPMTPTLDNKMSLFEPRLPTPVDHFKDEVGLRGNVVGDELLGKNSTNSALVAPTIVISGPSETNSQLSGHAPGVHNNRDSIESIEALQKRLRDLDLQRRRQKALSPNCGSSENMLAPVNIHQRMLQPRSRSRRRQQQLGRLRSPTSPLASIENMHSVHTTVVSVEKGIRKDEHKNSGTTNHKRGVRGFLRKIFTLSKYT